MFIILICLIFTIPPTRVIPYIYYNDNLFNNPDFIAHQNFFSDYERKKLANLGITRLSDYRNYTTTKTNRNKLEKLTDFSHKKILTWSNYADLMRIKDISPNYAILLEEVGVDTIKELSNRNPINLYEVIRTYDIQKLHIKVDKPKFEQITNWIDKAKKLPRGIEY